MTRGAALRVGATIWTFDGNRRVYKQGQSGPVYREYFVARVVTGENRSSWLMAGDYRVDKKTLLLKKPSSDGYFGMKPDVYLSEQEVDDACYVNDYRHQIAESVLECKDASLLRQVAALFNSETGGA